MKANELMVGDLVKLGKRILRCKNILGHTNDVMFENGVITNVMNIDPIPLTPEILEKNGFYWGYPVDIEDMASNVFGGIGIAIEMQPKSWVWDEGDGVVSVIFPNECDGGQITVTYNDKCINFVFSDTVNVHELQHVLRLCGIDKEIEL